jgi:hypothetical protein
MDFLPPRPFDKSVISAEARGIGSILEMREGFFAWSRPPEPSLAWLS